MEMKTCVLVCKALVVVYCSIFKIRFVAGQESDNEDTTKGPPVDHHTFVTLIDIVFTDYSKKTCTGTIIHDYVVITAAHCFFQEKNKNAKPELTTSFVVIGTKKMFETGYEQYLPIERVVIHPRYNSWTADLALVFTFAGMTSDKPGNIISLAGERTATPVDSNVTVLSWGHTKDDVLFKIKTKKITKALKCSESESAEHKHHPHENPTQAWRAGGPPGSHEEEVHEHKHLSKRHTDIINKKPTTTRTYKTRFRTVKQEEVQRHEIELEGYKPGHFMSRYLTSRESGNFTQKRSDDHIKQNEHVHVHSAIVTDIKQELRNITEEKKKEEIQIQNMKLAYHNWRRAFGPQQNKLTVEVFGFVNMQTCKKFVEKEMPGIYAIKTMNDIVCYVSDDHLITSEDSGAPAVRNGQLVAVTVGGVESDGDHVAVGMKMSCYCSWIADNLPIGSPRMHCCKNCCDVIHGTNHTHKNTTEKYRNKYLF